MSAIDPHILFRDDTTGQVTLFAEPEEIITARTPAEFFSGLQQMETVRARGKWLAGYMSYEAGYLFEQKLAPKLPENRQAPLLCFGVFDKPQEAGHPLAQQRVHTSVEPLRAPRAA